MQAEQCLQILNTDKALQVLNSLYGSDAAPQTRERYISLCSEFNRQFGDLSFDFYSTPGRTELSGNHTDHNHGKVLAASVQMDSVAAASPAADNEIRIFSAGYPQAFVVDISDLDVKPRQFETTEGIIRGMAAGFKQQGYTIGGFRACINSTVLPGSGLSSSASIEVLIGTIFNHLYNQGSIDPLSIAKIGQFAENNYFGKPCGLMDQVACASGGIVTIDFKIPGSPEVDTMQWDLHSAGYALFVVNTGGSHADLTSDYAAIPEEMKAVARYFEAGTCREISRQQIEDNLPALREQLGDRAVLRAFHFLDENERVTNQVAALKDGDYEQYRKLMQASGDSSFLYLQNTVSMKHPRFQSIPLALYLAARILDNRGACRVHGGGFAGTIQALVPMPEKENFKTMMESHFGIGSVTELIIRETGTCLVPITT